MELPKDLEMAKQIFGNEFEQFREEFGIRHLVCPVYDHRGYWKCRKTQKNS